MRDDDSIPTAPERPSGQRQLYDTIRSCSGVLPDEFEVAETIRPPEPLVLRTLSLELSDEPGRLPLVVLSNQDDDEADFTLFEELGRGGEGVVLLAEQRSMGREVALKRTRKELRNPIRFKRLLEEATLAGRLEHPNIIPVHLLAQTEDAEPVMVMKRVVGSEWRSMIQDAAHPAWAHRLGERMNRHLEIFVQVCNAVDYAHSRGLLHLDIKPANVMVGEFGEVYLMDWGLAAVFDAQGGVDLPGKPIMGTPAYMAPEMVPKGNPSRVDARTDVFLLGATLFEIVAGNAPFAETDIFAALCLAYEAKLPDFPADAPEDLVAICQKACAKDPNLRYKSVAALREDVSHALQRKGSMKLARAAERALGELEQLFAERNEAVGPSRRAKPEAGSERARGGATPSAREDWRQRFYEKSSACCFAAQQALLEWSDNDRALRALQNALELTIEVDLENRDGGRAASHLATLPVPHDELSQRVAALQTELESEGDAREKLRVLRLDAMIESDGWARTLLTLGNGAAWAISLEVAFFCIGKGWVHPSPLNNLFFGVGAVVYMMLVLFALRRFMLDNRIRRQITAATWTYTGAFLLLRIVALISDLPLQTTISMDLVCLTLFIGVMATFVDRLIYWGAGLALLTTLSAALWPIHAIHMCAALIFSLNAIMAAAQRPPSRKSNKTPEPRPA